jgi:antigen flippase
VKGGVLASTAGVFGAALCWLLGFKVVALWMGPEGVGLFSQLRQVIQAATVAATFGGTTVVVQGLAEREDELARRRFRTTAFRYTGIAGTAIALVMAIGAQPITLLLFSSADPDIIATVRWIAAAVLLSIGATYSLAVLNGYRSYRDLAVAQIAGPTLLVALLVGAWWLNLPASSGLLAGSFVLCFGVTCLLAAYGVSHLPRLESESPPGALSKDEGRVLIRFAMSTLVSAMATTLTLLLVRSWVIEAKGLAFAGLFDAGWTLTFNYTTLLLTACNAIYLPLLTAARHPREQRACMLKTAYLVLGISILACNALVWFREPLLDLFYSSEFQESGRILMILVIAVIFRGVSWVYGTLMLATRSSRALVASDMAANLLLLAATRHVLNNSASLEALGWAFVLPNFLYFVFVVEFARVKNRLMRRRDIWPLLAGGTIPLICLTLVSTGSPTVTPEPVTMICAGIGLVVAIGAFVAHRKVVP